MKRMTRRGHDETLGQMLRYGVIGIVLAGLYAAIYWTGAILLDLSAQLANAAGFATALVAGYALHSNWSFRGHGQRSSWSWGRFLVVNFVGYLLNCVWVWMIVDAMSYPVALSILPIVTFTPAFTFLLNRGWTFA